MARRRMIDPEFWSDEEIGEWSFQARLFYIALWNFSDDEGRLKAHNSLLKSEVFPYDKRINIAKLKQEVASKVTWYNVNGSEYGFLINFLKHQKIDRPTPSKLPPPPEIDESSTNPRRGITPEVKLSKDKEKIKSENFFSDTDFSLAEYLKEKILLNSPKEKITDSQLNSWADICRLMRERDNRTYDEIKGLIQFVHGDEGEEFPRNEFWFSNIRSMGKLREHFGRLWDEMVKAGYTIESEVKNEIN